MISSHIGQFNAWPWVMAWRDSRASRKRLLLSFAAIALGIAALVAIHSFRENLGAAIDTQAQSLLGADLMIRDRQPFSPATQALFDSIGGEQAFMTQFASMVLFTKSDQTRLAQVRALSGPFPFYGELETDPPAAAHSFREGPRALMDDNLMRQFDAQVGDSIRIGLASFEIVGRLLDIPGESEVSTAMAPRVYIPQSEVERTELIRPGSRAEYFAYFKFPPKYDVEALAKHLKPHTDRERLRVETVNNRKERLGRALSNLYSFLSLVGFIALLLGGLGVASSIHVYVRSKLEQVALLRCVGAQSQQALAIYLIQTAMLALAGAAAGIVLGLAVQQVLPQVFGDFLPVATAFTVSWRAIALGLLLGLLAAIMFALPPLLTLRHVSPLMALRATVDVAVAQRRWLARWLPYALVAVFLCGFAVLQAPNTAQGLVFVVAIVAAFALIAAVSKLIVWATRRYFPSDWSYVWRQALANLHRPNNQTLVLMLTIGLGTFLISSLLLTQQALLRQIELTDRSGRPNLILFDIQPEQKEQVADLIASFDLPIIQQVPVVTMRLQSIKGRAVVALLADSTSNLPRWALSREYRSTYRDSLIDSETLLAGRWRGRATDTVFVSLEADLAGDLHVEVGDELVFDVQGLPVTTVVGSLRRVDWQRMQTNFFVVFPAGVLEAAPQVNVLITRVSTNALSARVQRAVVQQFPNVSAIDLQLILKTFDRILDKIAFVIRFMALFSILTGIVVLIGALTTSRFQRLQESVLLRTLGASRAQITQIMIVEYLLLGGMAALTGLLLAHAATWAFTYFVFDAAFVPSPYPIAAIFLAVAGLTILIGTLNSRGLLARPPLEVLRAEVG